MATGQTARAGESTGKGLVSIVDLFIKQRQERKAEAAEDELVKALEGATKQLSEPIAPITPATKAAPVSPAPAPVPESQLDPLEAALSGIREEEGEVETGPTGQPLPPTPGKTVRERADTAAFKSAIVKEKQAQQILAQERQDQAGSGLTLTQAVRAASKIRAPGTEEFDALVEDLTRISKDASLQNMAKAISARMNAQGATTTPESILRQGAENVVNMSQTFKDLPPHTKIQIIEERKVLADGNTGFRKIAVIAEGPEAGKIIGPAGNPEFVPSPIARTQDVNATGLAKRRDLVDRRLTDFVVFARTADRVINALTPESTAGGMVAFAGKQFGNIRSMTALFLNQFSPDGMDIQFDPDNPPLASFAGLDFMSEKTRNQLQLNANLRSTYAHMAILYFRSNHPQAKSMSRNNLKNSIKALGGDLNDPTIMKNTLRNLVQNMALRAEIESQGVDMSSRDPAYDPRIPYKLLSGENSPNGRYYVPSSVAFNLKIPTDDAAGFTLKQFSELAPIKALERQYYDTSSRLYISATEVLERLRKFGYENIPLEELATAEFDKEFADLLRDQFKIGVGELADESFQEKDGLPSMGEITGRSQEALEAGNIPLGPEGIDATIKEVPF